MLDLFCWHVMQPLTYLCTNCKLSSNKLVSLEITGVSGGFMVMAVGEDRVVEGVLQGNVDVTFVG